MFVGRSAAGFDQGRYLLAVTDAGTVIAAAANAAIPAINIGSSNASGELQFTDSDVISVEEMEHLVETTLPDLMAGPGKSGD